MRAIYLPCGKQMHDRSRDDLERAEQQVPLGPGDRSRLEPVRRNRYLRGPGDPRRQPGRPARARRHFAHRPDLHPEHAVAGCARPRGRRGRPRLPARLEPVANPRVAGQARRDPRRHGQARLGHGGRRLDFRGRGGAGLGLAAYRRASDRQDAPHPLVQPLRPAPRLGGHHPPSGGRGLVLLPALPHGALARGRLAEAGGRNIRRLHAGNGPVPMVPLRGPPARRRGGLDEAARRPIPAHRPLLGRQLPPERARLVRPADGGAGRFRRHRHLLLHARAPGHRAPPHKPPAGKGGVRCVLRPDDPSLRGIVRCGSGKAAPGSQRAVAGRRLSRRWALVRDAIEPCPLAFLAEEGALAAEHVATVVAHPDDETLGCGALLPRLKGVTLVHVTDGAPRNMDDGATHGFASPEAYAAARRAELEAAVALAGVGPDALVGLGVPDQGAAFRLPDLACRLAALFRERGVTLVLTHAYEGGHPDHDAAALAVHAARRSIHDGTERAPPPIAVVEMPLYHASPSGWTMQRFIPDPERPELVVWLDAGQRELKRRMLAAHATQAATLAAFTLDFERFRLAPDYDFTILPNGGDLLYERYDWGLTGARWRTLARAALDELGLERVA